MKLKAERFEQMELSICFFGYSDVPNRHLPFLAEAYPILADLTKNGGLLKNGRFDHSFPNCHA